MQGGPHRTKLISIQHRVQSTYWNSLSRVVTCSSHIPSSTSHVHVSFE